MNQVDTAVAPRRSHRARWVAGAVLVITVGLVAVLATRPPASVTEVQSPLVGRTAPPVAGTTLSGTSYRLPTRPGHYVVVNFSRAGVSPASRRVLPSPNSPTSTAVSGTPRC